MKTLRNVVAILVAVVALGGWGCAGSPEAKLKEGYAAASNTVRSTTVLVDRDAISVEQAKRVKVMAEASKETLDTAAEELRKCRALEAGKCDSPTAAISMGAGVLQQLETYLGKLAK